MQCSSAPPQKCVLACNVLDCFLQREAFRWIRWHRDSGKSAIVHVPHCRECPNPCALMHLGCPQILSHSSVRCVSWVCEICRPVLGQALCKTSLTTFLLPFRPVCLRVCAPKCSFFWQELCDRVLPDGRKDGWHMGQVNRGNDPHGRRACAFVFDCFITSFLLIYTILVVGSN